MQIWKRITAVMAALMLVCAPALADQSNLYSPTTGTVSGLNLTNNYNAALNALATCNSGASAPSNQLSGVPSAGNCWYNTSTGAVSTYDGTSWLTIGYLDATNHVWTPIVGGGAATTVASAATTNLCGASGASPTGAYLTISGTTTISSFGSNCATGQVKILVFSGALTLTYNVTSMILPTGASLTTAAGDMVIAVALGSGNWRVMYLPFSGRPAGTLPPQITVYTSGSGTYSTPAGALDLDIEMCGGGSGGSGGGSTTTGGAGGAGGATTFGSLTANGGAATPTSGSTTLSTPSTATGGDLNIAGVLGEFPTFSQTSSAFGKGGLGAATMFGAGGSGAAAEYTGSSSFVSAQAATAPGAGGGGGVFSGAGGTGNNGWGGNSGACLKKVITSPSASYSYAVGAAGAAGTAGTNGSAGAAGAPGVIHISARYQ